MQPAQKGSPDRIGAHIHFQVHLVSHHGAEDRHIQGMFINIILRAPQVLDKIKLFIHMTIAFRNVCHNDLNLCACSAFFRLLQPLDPVQFLLDCKDTDTLEPFKFNVLRRHRRNRLGRLQNINTYQAKIPDTDNPLRCKF